MDNGTVRGWPFLIARGRRRGYEVLLAPDFLVTAREYGFLEEVAGPARQAGAPRIARVTAPGGRPVCLVWTEYVVRGDDIGPGVADPVDEHSRPLLLVHGFLCADSTVVEPTGADLDHAHDAALDTYRSFLADEEGFTVRPSPPFVLRSAHQLPAPTISPGRVTPGVVSRGTGTAAALAVVAVALITGVVLLGVTLFRPAAQQTPTPPPTCTSTAQPGRPHQPCTAGRQKQAVVTSRPRGAVIIRSGPPPG